MLNIFKKTERENLKSLLIKENKTRWLDIGSGGNLEEGFHFLDQFPAGVVDSRFRDKYYRADIANLMPYQIADLGRFDFIRMQHVIEHFTPEDATAVLKNCAALLKPAGNVLITVPDMKIHIKKYLDGGYQKWENFKSWAKNRIPEDAPDSYYFSIFTHSLPFESHKWCYDYKGLEFMIKGTGLYTNIKEIKFDDDLALQPFTHNRPDEDVCLIAELAGE